MSHHSLSYADHDALQTVDHIPIKNLFARGVSRLFHLPTSSCHGLILLYDNGANKDWAIWNPLSRDYLRLSARRCDCFPELVGVGLGYDYAADDYKVVQIHKHFSLHNAVLSTCIYSLKSRTWKLIKNCSSETRFQRTFGVYLNGALYWINKTAKVALDLATEDFRLLPLPPLPAGVLNIHLDSLDGCLFVSYHYTAERIDGSQVDECVEVWIRKDGLSIEVMWIKLFSFAQVQNSVGGYGMTIRKPVAYSKSRGEVILQFATDLYCFYIRRNCKKKIIIHGFPKYFECQDFQASLFRLVDAENDDKSDAAAKSTLTRKRKRNRKKKWNQRLKLSITVEDL